MAGPPSNTLLNDAPDAALGLTLAVIEASPTPLLLLDADLRLVAASGSFCEAFGIEPRTARGCEIFALGTGEWDVGELRRLLGETASGVARGEAFEMELKRSGRPARCLVIQTRRIVHPDIGNPLLLLAIADVTDARADARAKDEVVEHIGVLLREVRHRVANSLQIVSSVLLQNARRTDSAETRGHLKDAHHRVMAIAALERQLSESANGSENVELGAYFTGLRDSIAASLIDDAHPIALVVTGGGMVSARVSVSLGLIVTELVINALKHAFPGDRSGKIQIDYMTCGPNWTLSVRDDGVGMPSDPSQSHIGLGTNIVQALARQLQATVQILPARPGTEVCIQHTQIALVGGDEGSPKATPLHESRRTEQERGVRKRTNADG